MNHTILEYKGLYERLSAYAESDFYPFHMPGHKRAKLPFPNPYQIDITEIDGFDNLHCAEEILLEAQERLKKLYRSRKSFYLVNGSTCGILSAAGALSQPGDQVLIARNCHKSVYNAVKLFGLRAGYIYPEIMKCGIQGQVNADAVRNALRCYPDTKLVVLTSPTYDGIVSDIGSIAKIVHKQDAYLIVDEAHGAHFSLGGPFPESALRLGADIVIQSLHKTLPSFTQTAALHIGTDRVDADRVMEMLVVFQTSSPSYLFMAGMEQCVAMLEQSGKQMFDAFDKKLSGFYDACQGLERLHVLDKKDYEAGRVFDADRSKIVISTQGTSMDGKKLYDMLLERYHLQMELYSAQYVLAMTSIMDTQEGFDRLLRALLEIDAQLRKKDEMQKAAACWNDMQDNENEKNRSNAKEVSGAEIFLRRMYGKRKKVLEISETRYYNKEEILLQESAGRVCAEYIYLYPPGIPAIVPGEEISLDFIKALDECRRTGLNVLGMKDQQCRRVSVITQIETDRCSQAGAEIT